MNKRLIGTALGAAVVLSCSQAMTAEQKIEMLESQRLEILSDLHRQKAECEAQAIEFANSKNQAKIVTACFDSYRVSVEGSQVSLEKIDRRIDELEKEIAKSASIKQFDTNEKKLDLTYDPNWKPKNLVPFDGKLDAEK